MDELSKRVLGLVRSMHADPEYVKTKQGVCGTGRSICCFYTESDRGGTGYGLGLC